MVTWIHLPLSRLVTITAVLALALVPGSSAGPGGASESTAVGSCEAASAARSQVTLLGRSSPEQRAMVEWAVERFAVAGLELPDVRIEFKALGCRSRGQYDRATQTIDVCDGRKMTLLHELAHAWDASAVFDRDGFLELRDLDIYFGPPGTPPADEGAEHVAEIIAWGLMDGDTAVPGPAYESQPVAEYQPRLASLPDSSVAELHAAFVFLTGCEPLHAAGSDRVDGGHSTLRSYLGLPSNVAA